jgi:hypothetical protein
LNKTTRKDEEYLKSPIRGKALEAFTILKKLCCPLDQSWYAQGLTGHITIVWYVVRYQILKLEFQIFFYFLCFVIISTKGTKSKNYIFSFYLATFEHSLNWGETAEIEF